jgi:primosomal protein N' (replication factor Y)
VSRIAKVEPLTTARAMRGPFDYLRPEGAEIGSLLVVPFGRRDVVGVVTGIASASQVSDDRLMAPRRVLPNSVPPELIALAEWMAGEYVSTFARSLQLMLPPARVREKTALWAEIAAGDDKRITPAQQELLD